ncbi:GAF domain-containing protein [Pedobacter sp. UBA5917]|jgi:light-regulated signal transduction histidine kinase (bacteriophytochrome)|uniref:GAF domain-containing protein n=1 Tax=Pedobacter sp. UBA5917 TaxID=1947061 RepID=UPI0025FD4CCF|nr:GAF domain-containing protein [Pedobacter sp. UBA5917]
MSEIRNYDAEFCGNLPIHHINSIQDYGYLLVLDNKTLNIIQVSENLNILTGKAPAEIINKHLSAWFSENDVANITKLIKGDAKDRIPLNLVFENGNKQLHFDGLIHIKNDYSLLEIEVSSKEGQKSFSDVFQEVRQFISAMESASTLEEVCNVAIRQLRKVSGFDGVRMYQFDASWNGTVIAEEISGALESYLGQTFPASDVPKQARALYLKNPFRLIPNRAYQPVRLYPVINPLTNAFIDLSDCNLRGVASVHLEYMQNMNVSASMSIRVLREGKLWGLISCHHIEPNYPNVDMRYIFEWLSVEISNRIAAILNQEEYNGSALRLEKRAALTDFIYSKDDIIEGLLDDENLNILSLFNAGGAVIKIGNRIEYHGDVPDKSEIYNLMLWLEGKEIEKVFASSHLSELYEEAKAYEKVGSGILVIPVDGRSGDYVICFRPEVIRQIKWGGDPEQVIKFDQDGKNYHPRNSFKLWLQTVYGQSLPWSQNELEIAESLRNFIFEFRTKQLYN